MYRELSTMLSRCGSWKVVFRIAWGVLVTSALVACSGNTIPFNAVLNITPRSHSAEITEFVDEAQRCIHAPDNFMDIPLVLQLSTADGSPIGESAILVYADFSENTYPGYAVLALFDDVNSNGVIDSDTELLSGFDDDIAIVNSGKYTGAKTLLLRINLSCSFRGEIRAIAGGVSGSAVVEVIGTSTVGDSGAAASTLSVLSGEKL